MGIRKLKRIDMKGQGPLRRVGQYRQKDGDTCCGTIYRGRTVEKT